MRTAICLALLIVSAGRVAAQPFEQRAKLQFLLDKNEAKPGDTVGWKIKLDINQNFHSYPSKQPNGEESAVATDFRLPKYGEFIFVGAILDPPTNGHIQEEGKEIRTYEGPMTVTWEGQFVVHPEAKPGKVTLEFRVTVPVCNNLNCTSGAPKPVEFTILDGKTEYTGKYEAEVKSFPLRKPEPKAANPPAALNGGPPVAQSAPAHGAVEIAPLPATFDEADENMKAVREKIEKFTPTTPTGAGGLWSFLAAAALWGAIALFTPCVFPMIPITVSFFLHQSEKEHHRPVRMALIYCGTIILVLGISALTLLTTFRELSVDPYMNIGLGLLFVALALSLFGVFEITLPSKLTQFTSSREGKGGTIGTVFMALTFTIVSFTCVAPFLGGFGGMAAGGKFSTWELVLGALVFSTTFASPFFFLALFPTLIKKLPQSGSWLNSVKVVMGFLELAAALKFLRTAELRLLDTPKYFTYDLVLGIWVALALVTGLYLLNLFRLSHDETIEKIGVVRMLLGVAFLSFAIYLVPAMFKQTKTENQRPRGEAYAWIDAFLLPEATEEELPVSGNLKGTIDLARKEFEKTGRKQYLFIDFTGKTCTNCRYNERTIFSRPDVRELLLKCRLVQLYTDEVPGKFYPEEVEAIRRVDEARKINLLFQKEIFLNEQLPLYVMLEVHKERLVVRGVYDEGKINEADKFIKWLKDSRKEEKK